MTELVRDEVAIPAGSATGELINVGRGEHLPNYVSVPHDFAEREAMG